MRFSEQCNKILTCPSHSTRLTGFDPEPELRVSTVSTAAIHYDMFIGRDEVTVNDGAVRICFRDDGRHVTTECELHVAKSVWTYCGTATEMINVNCELN